ncbi:unnamed protein product [Mytilus edulis]|uniref:Uncharacterized protein n=1 Tax=Mytilus edulis TaxID=6550 RepID=A0A8S3PPG4_MYTED|nr:unnamed protein product [Mytilus edulis]
MKSILWNMNSLSFIVLFHVLTGIHGEVMYTNLTDDCLVKELKHICTKSYKKTKNCSKEDCRKLLSLSIDSQNSNDNIDDDNKERKRNGNAEGNYKNRDRKNYKKAYSKSKRKKRKKQRRQQSIDQRFEMKNLESGSSSTNKREYIVVSENKSLNTYEEQGQNYVTVLDSSITKYDKDFRNRKLPEIKRCSGAEGGENVYYEIDEDKILPEIKRFSVPQGDKRVYNEIDEDMEGVCQKEIEEFKDKYPYNGEQNIYETPSIVFKKMVIDNTTLKYWSVLQIRYNDSHTNNEFLDVTVHLSCFYSEASKTNRELDKGQEKKGRYLQIRYNDLPYKQ